MARWPTQIDYQDALKVPAVCFIEPALRTAKVTDRLLFGLPRPITGQFANVYRMRTRDGSYRAVRLFLTPSAERAVRYAALTDHLSALGEHVPASFVPFRYLERGIIIEDAEYPVVWMEWADGVPLDAFIETHLYDSKRLRKLAESWRELTNALSAARIAHGDLQHGNILVKSGEDQEDTLQLIDYDGVWVPALKKYNSPDLGHQAYQHPERRIDDFGPALDRFSALVIYASLRAVAAAPAVWYRLHDGNNLLFRGDDLREPDRGRAFPALADALRRDHDETRLVEALRVAALSPAAAVPDLDSIMLY